MNDASDIIDIEAIGARYETKGLFARLGTLFGGLAKPHGTREYKEARIELQRLAAPLAAVLSVGLFVVALVVVTAVTATQKKPLEITIATVEEPPDFDPGDLPPEPPEPPEIDMNEPVVVDIPVTADVPPPSLDKVLPPAPVAVADRTKVQAAPSPVAMTAIKSGPRKSLDGASDFGAQIKGNGKSGLPEGVLIGEIIDFKRNAQGADRTGALGNLHATNDYWERVAALFKGRFSEASYKEVYRLPMRVALSSLWVPPQSAANGPKAFGAQEYMEPKYWAAHYTGTLAPTKKMRCRFIGYFDDVMVVAVDGKVVLDVYWAMDPAQPSKVTGWKSPDPSASRFAAPQSACRMIVGDWVDFDPKKPVQFDLVCGEKPGGAIGGLLCIEEEGADYEKTAEGRPKWPIFTTIPLSPRQKMAFEKAGYAIGTNPPRFNYRPRVDAKAEMAKNDVAVDVTI